MNPEEKHFSNEELLLTASLFINTGDGFFITQKLCQAVSKDTRHIQFDVNEYINIQGLRFHPDEYPVNIYLKSITLHTTGGNHQPGYHSDANYDINGYMEFSNENPHIIIETKDISDIQTIHIELVYRKVRFEKILELYRELNIKKSSLDKSVDRIQKSICWKLKSKWDRYKYLFSRLGRNLKKLKYKTPAPIPFDEAKSQMDQFHFKPLISIIMPVYNTDPKWLEKAINSVYYQYYPEWELCIADDGSANVETINYLKSIQHPRIKTFFSETNENISQSSNHALSLATGEFVGLMDHDDMLTPDALFEIVKYLNDNEVDFIYSDEDKIDKHGRTFTPNFKPDYNPDMLFERNYISHFAVIRKTIVDEVGGFEKGLEGSQDHDFYLKVMEHTDKIGHIPKVLYHWRKTSDSSSSSHEVKDYAWEAGKKAVNNALSRRKIPGKAQKGILFGTYRIDRELMQEPLVSIIMPFRDKPELLRLSIQSIIEKTTYNNYEIIGINNNSEQEETLQLMKEFKASDKRIKFYDYPESFNYSALNNFGTQLAKGEHFILMNNDIEVITPNWIEILLQHSQRKEVGAVGGKLYYPDDTIQHAGVIIGMGGIAGHGHKRFRRDDYGYFGRLVVTQNISAVTAALMMVKRDYYLEVNGFDENLKVAFNDVDFCLRLREKGFLNVWTPWCEMYHHESKTRGYEDSYEKQKRFQVECDYFTQKYSEIMKKGDPYYNPNLSLKNEKFEY